MSALVVMVWIGAGIALSGLAMTLANLRVLSAARGRAVDGGMVSVCIPARNEAGNIGACIESVVASEYRNIEVLVYDDESTDGTGAIVDDWAQRDARVRRVATAAMPEGWNGKQHACWRMSRGARGRWLLFTDADVRFGAGAVGAAVGAAAGKGLVSAFPRQVTGTAGEALLVPMMFFILLTYLPMWVMRRSRMAACSAACGQFILISREAYDASGGHGATRASMHEGVMLPRAVRHAGFMTDLIDGMGIVSCRMYRGWGESWRGFAKNAYEGVGSVGLLAVFTVMHVLGHVLGWGVLAWALVMRAGHGDAGAPGTLVLGAGTAVCAGVVQRILLSKKFGHPVWLAAAHPVTVVLMTGVQWWSLVLHALGAREWKGRRQGSGGGRRAGSVADAAAR